MPRPDLRRSHITKHAENMKTLSLLVALVMSSGLCFAQDAVGYDEFAQLSMEERIQVFNEIDLENRAAIVREQAQRWLARNRARLSEEQVALYGEMLDFIEPAKYDGLSPEEERAAIDLTESFLTLFSLEDYRDAFTNEAPYIPPIADEEDPD
ncbi:MAG: hypothetical protein AAF809_03415 [Bacteroidota bacterium]